MTILVTNISFTDSCIINYHQVILKIIYLFHLVILLRYIRLGSSQEVIIFQPIDEPDALESE
jgi:hypothetical protein